MAGNVYDPAGVLQRMPKAQTFDVGQSTIPDNWTIDQGVPSGYKATWQANPNSFGPGMASGSTKGTQLGDYQLQALQPGENPAYDVYQGQQKANQANETRYQDTLKLLGDTYASAMGLEQQKGLEPQLYDENLRYQNQTGGLKNNLLSRGLYNSTLLNSQQQGLDRTHSINSSNIQNQALDRLINMLTAGGNAKARVMEGKTDQQPDANAMAAAMDQAGAFGGGGEDGGQQKLGGWGKQGGVSDQTMWELNNLPPNQWSKATVAEASKYYGGYNQLMADYQKSHGGTGASQGQITTSGNAQMPVEDTYTPPSQYLWNQPSTGQLQLGSPGTVPGSLGFMYPQDQNQISIPASTGSMALMGATPSQDMFWAEPSGDQNIFDYNMENGGGGNWWEQYGYENENDLYNDYFPGWDEEGADAP